MSMFVYLRVCVRACVRMCVCVCVCVCVNVYIYKLMFATRGGKNIYE